MVQNDSRDAEWTVCDASSGANAGVTVLGGPVASGGERARPLADDQAVLVSGDAGAWLLWDGRRSPVDLANRAVTDALGFGATRRHRGPSPPGCSTPSPRRRRWPPAHPGCRCAAAVPAAGRRACRAVVAAFEADNTIRYYAVLPDGLQPVPKVLAAILRNTNSYGLNQPPRLGADEVSRLPVSQLLDTDAYPADPSRSSTRPPIR